MNHFSCYEKRDWFARLSAPLSAIEKLKLKPIVTCVLAFSRALNWLQVILRILIGWFIELSAPFSAIEKLKLKPIVTCVLAFSRALNWLQVILRILIGWFIELISSVETGRSKCLYFVFALLNWNQYIGFQFVRFQYWFKKLSRMKRN